MDVSDLVAITDPLCARHNTNCRAWMVGALCAEIDPELFYPAKGESSREAKSICASCDVRTECLEYALHHTTAARFGVWGGLSEKERRREARKRGIAGPPAVRPRAAA